MELELALKITRTRDDITSTADLRITKDPFGPVFLSRETSKMFILIAHLKGFRIEDIHIEINKDGNRIEIRGAKPVQEMLLNGWIMCKKEVEIKAFKKVFRIPAVVDLDRIKAKYNEEESTLTVTMPKKVRGIFGFEIEEEKEEEPKITPVVADDVPDRGSKLEGLLVETSNEENVNIREAEEPPKEEIVETKTQSIEDTDEGQFTVQEERPEELPEIDVRETDHHAEEKVEKEKTEAPENAIHEEPKIVQDVIEKRPEEPQLEIAEEIEQVLEKPQETPEEKTAQAETEEPEVVELEPQRDIDQIQMVEPPLVEEVFEKEPPDEIQTASEPEEKAAIHVADEVTEPTELTIPPSTQAEEKTAIGSDRIMEGESPEKSEKQEGGTDAEELTHPELDQKPKQPEPPPVDLADESDKNEVYQQMGTQETEDEIVEANDIPKEVVQREGPSEEPAPKKLVSKKRKLCAPLMFAGSAFLVSLIVIVIHLIRAKRRS